MKLYSFINVLHYPIRLHERDDYLLVVRDVLARKLTAFSILQPLLSGLVAADVEIPRNFRHTAEILVGVDIYLAILVDNLFDDIRAAFRIRSDVLPHFRRFKQVQLSQLFAESN